MAVMQIEVVTHLPDGRFPTTLAYSPNGTILAVGQTNGSIFLLDALTLRAISDNESVAEFRFVRPTNFPRFDSTIVSSVAKDKIKKLVFSQDSQLLAFSDAENAVGYLQVCMSSVTAL